MTTQDEPIPCYDLRKLGKDDYGQPRYVLTSKTGNKFTSFQFYGYAIHGCAFMRRLGIAFAGGRCHHEIASQAKLAEENGFESIWFTEGLGGDAFSLATACALSTEHVYLGTAVTSVFTRSPTIIAMASATVQSISDGRFRLGLGSSHRVQVQGEHGLSYGQPMQRVRETVDIVRRAFEEGKVTYTGRIFNIEGFEFRFEKKPGQIPIYLGAVFGKMLETAGEIGDGVILTLSTLDQVTRAAYHVAEGARRAGRNPSNIDLASLIDCYISKNTEKAKRVMKKSLARSVGHFPRYNRLVSEGGFAREATMIRRCWLNGNTNEAAKAVSDDLIDALAIVGPPEECRQRLEEFRNAGVALPILCPVDEVTRGAVIETFAE